MSAAEMHVWAEVAASGVGRCFSDYRSHGTVESLHEVRAAVTGLSAIAEELISRHEVTSD